VLSGLLVGWIVRAIQRPLQGSALQTMISLATPYCAYLLGEGIHASGVLATVACGLYLGQQASTTYTSEARLDSHAVWNTIDFILNGLVFILIGLQLPAVLPGMRPLDWPRLLGAAIFLSLLLICLRMLWLFPGSRISAMIRQRVLKQPMTPLNGRQIVVLGWSGLRGVLTLAAALSLPETTATGAPFPHRDMILFLAFSVILVTLVGQGLTLPYITRRLRVCAASDSGVEERDARRAMAVAALAEVEALREGPPDDGWRSATHQRSLELLDQSYKRRLELIQREEDRRRDPKTFDSSEMETFAGVAARVREAERRELARLQAAAEINDMTLRKLERELDLMDVRSTHG
jgi:CPA1 family monovalent cation:H+ antiporter